MKAGAWQLIIVMRLIKPARFLLFSLLLFNLTSALAARNDVLIIVNDNSIDSPLIGNYYAQQRGIDPANIVHVNVPDSYFISWDNFRSLRDQLINFMQQNTLDDANLVLATCVDGEPPYYCQASMDQLRAHTKIRYLVTTRGVPTRMTVDGSMLANPSAPTSIDNYLKYWLINYFDADVRLDFKEREVEFGDGRGMRTVRPSVDRELIIGRIDGLNLDAAQSLVDRALAIEGTGIYGTWYGSTKMFSWKDANTSSAVYPQSDRSVMGWRYALGLWGEDRAECADYQNAKGYLNFSGFLAEGKAPAYCRVKFNDDSDPALQTNQRIKYPAPGNAGSRTPLVIDALGYQGWLDGQASVGNFNALLNWRKNESCTVTLCSAAADPDACRATSSDIFSELNTYCVGVADGFMAYNHSSYPMSYLVAWPTGWFQTTITGGSGWNDGGGGDVNQLAFPEVRNDDGFDDNNSLWIRSSDQVASPSCYAGSDFSGAPTVPCDAQRRLVLTQKVAFSPKTLDVNSPQTYQVSLRYKTINIAGPVDLRARLFVHETGAGNAQIDYGVQTLVSLSAIDSNGWVSAEVSFTLDPAKHNSNSYDGIKLTLDTPTAFTGDLGIDVVSLRKISSGQELLMNGSFSQGHQQVVTGDHAATFLNRLGGVAAWGSVSHHQSSGGAFALNGLETMVYFLRGLPLGDAVWFDESNNSGILYGDPLYSPVAVHLLPPDPVAIQNGSVDLFGSTINGHDPLLVDTTYRVDVCPGSDFYLCDQAQFWQATTISGVGGGNNVLLGTLDTTALNAADFVIRLQVSSTSKASGKSQVFADFYTVQINEPPVAIDSNLSLSEDPSTAERGRLFAADPEKDALIFSIVDTPASGTVVIDNARFGSYSYTPDTNASGSDSFTFKVSDGLLESNTATVTINIAAINDAPVAMDAQLATDNNVTVAGVLRASDVDNDVLTYSVVKNGGKGVVVITDPGKGAFQYAPNNGSVGPDSFTFKANDGQVDSNIATVSVVISMANVPPQASDSFLSVDEDTETAAVLNADDINGDLLTYKIVSDGDKGTVTIINSNTGEYIYIPDANVSGSDSFSFNVNDGILESGIAVVTVDIIPINDPPVVSDMSFNLIANFPVISPFNAADVDGDKLTYTFVRGPAKGSVSLDAITGVYTYRPDPGATGKDSFTYRASDGQLDSNIATITIQLREASEGKSSGFMNLLFILLFSIVIGLRFITVNSS